jgi:hypothetical protein
MSGRHAGQCEFASETDPDRLRVVLKVNDCAGDDYWWVTCGVCDCAWMVPHYGERWVTANPLPGRAASGLSLCSTVDRGIGRPWDLLSADFPSFRRC